MNRAFSAGVLRYSNSWGVAPGFELNRAVGANTSAAGGGRFDRRIKRRECRCDVLLDQVPERRRE